MNANYQVVGHRDGMHKIRRLLIPLLYVPYCHYTVGGCIKTKSSYRFGTPPSTIQIGMIVISRW